MCRHLKFKLRVSSFDWERDQNFFFLGKDGFFNNLDHVLSHTAYNTHSLKNLRLLEPRSATITRVPRVEPCYNGVESEMKVSSLYPIFVISIYSLHDARNVVNLLHYIRVCYIEVRLCYVRVSIWHLSQILTSIRTNAAAQITCAWSPRASLETRWKPFFTKLSSVTFERRKKS